MRTTLILLAFLAFLGRFSFRKHRRCTTRHKGLQSAILRAFSYIPWHCGWYTVPVPPGEIDKKTRACTHGANP